MKLGDLQEGMYIRYIPAFGEYTQKISKILKIENRILDMVYYLDNVKNGKEYVSSSYFDDVLKASHNIIDLIEENDIILGKDGIIYQIDNVDRYYVFTKNFNDDGKIITLVDYQIETILTKEQFENNCYILQDEEVKDNV